MKDDPFDLTDPSYTPVKLLNETAHLLRAKNDATLALMLECDHALLTRVRKRKYVVTPYLMVQIMDRTGWHIQDVRRLAGMPYDGAAKLVMLAQRIGFRHPFMWLRRPEECTEPYDPVRDSTKQYDTMF